MQIERRDMLRTASFGLAGLALSHAFSTRIFANRMALVADPKGIIDLPAGFSYQILDRAGDQMNDGYLVPGLPDGMACYGDQQYLYLMRNHELGREDWRRAAYSADKIPKQAFDRNYTGAVTRVVLDRKSGQVIYRNLVLAGTSRNCAGGMSPWGWMSCEEDVRDGHGYTFLCNPLATQVQSPQIIRAYGRFNHEAVCIEPRYHAAYLTEDRSDGALYRFLPDHPNRPFTGRLQALVLDKQATLHTGSAMKIGEELTGTWVNLIDTSPREDTLRYEAQRKGAATFARGEGIWYGNGEVYIAATSGGPIGRGQVFRLKDDIARGQARLQILCQSESTSALNCPDNLTVSPWGDVVIVEDGPARSHIRWIDNTGKIYNFARNALSDSEFAGVCFDPDGKTMFVNIQHDGLTLAINGPFGQFLQNAESLHNGSTGA